jgi:hypothetical protein
MRRLTSCSLPLLSAALLLAGSALAAAEPQATGGQGSTGPLVLSPIESHVVIAPDVKVTKLNGTTATLVGISAAKVTEERLMLGGGVYWLANPRDRARMLYGGFLAGWRVYEGGRFSVGAKGLLGLGRATLLVNLSDVLPFDRLHPDHGFHVLPGDHRIGVRDEFFIADPEVNVQVKLARGLRLDLGAGYRVTSAPAGLGDRLRGATGSVGVQFDIRRP